MRVEQHVVTCDCGQPECVEQVALDEVGQRGWIRHEQHGVAVDFADATHLQAYLQRQ